MVPPMSTTASGTLKSLSDVLAQPETRPQVVAAAERVLEEEVASKGLAGLPIKAAFKVVKAIKPGLIADVLENLIDDFAAKLDPFYQEAVASGGSVEAVLVSKKSEAADALLGITDARAERTSNDGEIGLQAIAAHGQEACGSRPAPGGGDAEAVHLRNEYRFWLISFGFRSCLTPPRGLRPANFIGCDTDVRCAGVGGRCQRHRPGRARGDSGGQADGVADGLAGDKATNGVTVVGSEASGRKGLDLYRKVAPSVVVLDPRQPGFSGADLVRAFAPSNRSRPKSWWSAPTTGTKTSPRP